MRKTTNCLLNSLPQIRSYVGRFFLEDRAAQHVFPEARTDLCSVISKPAGRSLDCRPPPGVPETFAMSP